MTLVSSIITDAYRESNMLALGKVPNDAQVTEALRLYNSLVLAVYGNDAGEPLGDWPLGTFDRDPDEAQVGLPYGADVITHPPINARLLVVNENAITVWLTPRPQDGARMAIADPYARLSDAPVTIEGNGRPIEDVASMTLATDGTFREWLYRADLGAWRKISALEMTDENPFPADFDDMFTILLAMRLNPRYGRTLDAQSLEILKTRRRAFLARYLQSRPLEIDDSISWPFLSVQSYGNGRTFSSQAGFNRGSLLGGR